MHSLIPAFALGCVLLATACGGEGGPLTPVFFPPDETFYVGPYIGHTGETFTHIGWETETSGTTRVYYGRRADSYDHAAVGPDGTLHQVRIEGLAPQTRYHYRACTGTTCTRDLTFDTAPRPGTPFSFGVYGDCQDNPDIHRQVVDRLIEHGAWLGMVVGDLVSDGRERWQYKERYFDAARAFAQVRPRYAAIGNHDRKDYEGTYFREYNMFPEDPAVPQTEVSYSFVYGDAFFLVIDNTVDHLDVFFPIGDWEPPLWLWFVERAQSAEARAARYRFAFAHYPPGSNCYPEGHEYGMPESAVKDYLLPLLKENGFHAYFAGHMHCYERFDYGGMLAITTGGGGGGLEDPAQCDDGLPEARIQDCVHHAVLVDLGPDAARFTVQDIGGRVIEQFEVAP